MPLIQPPDEIGWRSEFTASAWGPTYRIEDCSWCWSNSGWLHREAPNGEGLIPYPCSNCGGAGAIAVLAGPPPPWIFG